MTQTVILWQVRDGAVVGEFLEKLPGFDPARIRQEPSPAGGKARRLVVLTRSLPVIVDYSVTDGWLILATGEELFTEARRRVRAAGAEDSPPLDPGPPASLVDARGRVGADPHLLFYNDMGARFDRLYAVGLQLWTFARFRQGIPATETLKNLPAPGIFSRRLGAHVSAVRLVGDGVVIETLSPIGGATAIGVGVPAGMWLVEAFKDALDGEREDSAPRRKPVGARGASEIQK